MEETFVAVVLPIYYFIYFKNKNIIILNNIDNK